MWYVDVYLLTLFEVPLLYIYFVYGSNVILCDCWRALEFFFVLFQKASSICPQSLFIYHLEIFSVLAIIFIHILNFGNCFQLVYHILLTYLITNTLVNYGTQWAKFFLLLFSQKLKTILTTLIFKSWLCYVFNLCRVW